MFLLSFLRRSQVGAKHMHMHALGAPAWSTLLYPERSNE